MSWAKYPKYPKNVKVFIQLSSYNSIVVASKKQNISTFKYYCVIMLTEQLNPVDYPLIDCPFLEQLLTVNFLQKLSDKK